MTERLLVCRSQLESHTQKSRETIKIRKMSEMACAHRQQA